MRRLVLAAALALALPAAAHAQDFPRDFKWGTAIAGFQTEMGGRPAHRDTRSDWWAWTHDAANIRDKRVTADRPERGPGHWSRFRQDLALADTELHNDAFRLGVEWSRIFPRSTRGVKPRAEITRADLRRLDRLADERAVRHYRGVLREVRRRGMVPFVTLSHFTLPRWIHDPIAWRDALAPRGPDDPLPAGLDRGGWAHAATVDEFAKYAAYLAWKFGSLVDFWTPINEPMVVAASGYVNVPGVLAGNFPPGAFSFTAAIAVVQNLVRANEVAYDAVKRLDRRARVGPVHNMVAFTPADPGSARDRTATEHADRLFNRLFLDAVVRGEVDGNANGAIEPAEREPGRAGKADFIGVNYYFRGRVTGVDRPLTPTIPLLDFVPATAYRTPLHPTAPPCPTSCNELGSEVYPEGFRDVLRTAGGYRLPIYVTENGTADADDSERPQHLLDHLRVLREAMADRLASVRGYFHWSLIDNFEWAAGYLPKFGLYSFDPVTLERRARPSARLYGRIARRNALPPGARPR